MELPNPLSKTTIVFSLTVTIGYMLVAKNTVNIMLSVEVRATADQLYDYLKDLNTLPEIHPLITNVTILEHHMDPRIELESMDYELTEEVPYFGSLKHIGTARASKADHTVEFRTSVYLFGFIKAMTLNSTWVITEAPGSNAERPLCKLEDSFTCYPPMLLSAFTQENAIEAHTKLLENIKKRAERKVRRSKKASKL